MCSIHAVVRSVLTWTQLQLGSRSGLSNDHTMRISRSTHHLARISPSCHLPQLLPLIMYRRSAIDLAALTRHIVIHLNTLDPEHVVRQRGPNSPPRIAVRPIIPHPRPRLAGYIGRECLLQDAVDEEHRLPRHPIDAIFVQDADVWRCGAGTVGWCAARLGRLVRIL